MTYPVPSFPSGHSRPRPFAMLSGQAMSSGCHPFIEAIFAINRFFATQGDQYEAQSFKEVDCTTDSTSEAKPILEKLWLQASASVEAFSMSHDYWFSKECPTLLVSQVAGARDETECRFQPAGCRQVRE